MTIKKVKGEAAPLKNNQVYIKSGDTLSELAERLTGKGSNWRKIAEANGIKGSMIKPGQVLTIPEGMWNPVVANVEGKPMRWRSKEYKEAYPNLATKEGENKFGRMIGEVTVNAKEKPDVEGQVRKATNYVAKETAATALNTLDMPRRIVAGITNDNYSLKEAINPIGTQPYHSVVQDDYAKEHPYIAAGADIGTGLLAWNLPGITRSIVGTGIRAERTAAAIAKANDNIAAIGKMAPKQAKIAAQESRNTAKNFIGKKDYTVVTGTPTQSSEAGQVFNPNTTVATKVGKNIKGTGTSNQAKGTPYTVNRSVNSGKVNSGFQKGDVHVGTAQYPIPIPGPVVSPFIPIPGIPWTPAPTPIVTKPKERIDVTKAGQLTLDGLIKGNQLAIGDTLEMPSGEQIKYIIGDNPYKKKFDVSTKVIYDANNKDASKQYKVPELGKLTFTKGTDTVEKHTPQADKKYKRDKNSTFPYIVDGKATYEPIK